MIKFQYIYSEQLDMYRRILQLFQMNIQHFKTGNFFPFSPFEEIFAFLNPDPDSHSALRIYWSN